MTAASDRGTVLVTGASSGIGEALAFVFARNGHSVVLHGRSRERLDAIADKLAAETGRRPWIVTADLAVPGAVRELVDELARQRLRPRFVVNNAGFGLFGCVDKLSIEEQVSLIDVNCRALTEVTLSLLPGALEQRGGILNVGSVGGFFPGPGMAVYFASKAYVQSFSQALREEYRRSGLRVSALCPGPVATRFQARAGMISPSIPRLLGQTSEGVALSGYHGLMQNRAVVAPGFLNTLLVLGGGLMFHRSSVALVRLYHLGRPRRRKPAIPSRIASEPPSAG